MGSQSWDGLMFALVYGGLFVGAVWLFGLRRVLWACAFVVGLAVFVAIRTLTTVAGSRRY
ncbi:MAG: hypothetical protein M3285_02960 [Actinomycetota bacterium]|nr:hypothetical protein [Actinomycetota bacterium]MDQ3954492.1 hypothetical protein [Actinomycetota bacterium]